MAAPTKEFTKLESALTALNIGDSLKNTIDLEARQSVYYVARESGRKFCIRELLRTKFLSLDKKRFEVTRIR